MGSVSRAVWRIAIRSIVIFVVAMVLWFAGPWLWHLFSPFILALPVALALQKPMRWTEERLKIKHGISVTVWVFLVCAAIIALLYWLLATVITQVLQLSGNYQAIINDVIGLLRNVSNQIIDALDYMPASAEEWVRTTLNDAFAQLSTVATRWLGIVFNFVINFASGIPYGLIYLNFLLLGIFFIASSYARIRMRLLSQMGDDMRDRSTMLSGTAGQGLAGYIKVQSLYALLVIIVSYVCLLLFGMPYAFILALIACILEFLPIFGNGTLFIPISIICYVIGNPTLGTEILIMHLALFIFRRVTEPKLMSNQMGLSPLLSLIAMFAGMQLGGVLGLILAPVVVVVVQGAWAGGLFTATIADIRCLYAHLRDLLSEPPPCEEPTEPTDTDAEKPQEAAPAQATELILEQPENKPTP